MGEYTTWKTLCEVLQNEDGNVNSLNMKTASVTTCMELENPVLSEEVNQRKTNTVPYHLYIESEKAEVRE